jgi:hypothetical protein
MLQKEMFDRPMGEYLGRGVFSSAYRLSNGLVCKVGMNDGTRNWLEFCLLEREAGRLLPMMPEVYTIASIGEYRYMAIMPEYSSIKYSEDYGGGKCRAHVAFPELEARYRVYMEQFGGGLGSWDMFNDLHDGNVMLCPNRGVVITDPSTIGYKRINIDADGFSLH